MAFNMRVFSSFMILIAVVQLLIVNAEQIIRSDIDLMRVFPRHVLSTEQKGAHFDFVTSVSTLFRAKATKLTKKEIIQSHQEIFSRLHDISHSTYNTKHRFILRYQDQCGYVCHEPMMEEFGIDKYHIVNHNTAQLTVSITEMDTLKSKYAQRILDFTPTLPGLKVAENILSTCTDYLRAKSLQLNGTTDESLTSLASIDNHEVKIEPPDDNLPPQTVTVVTTELSVSEIKALIDRIHKETDGGMTYSSTDSLHEGIKNYLPFSFTADGDLACSNFGRMVDSIAEHREVQWIERYEAMYSLNRWAKGICQSGSSLYQPLTLRSTTGLTGAGQIVGVSDTGLDMSSCYFYDPDYPDTLVKSKSGSKTSSTHRKVVQYVSYQDSADDGMTAHGTHVCGSIAGKTYTAKSYGDFVKFNGVASSAKLSFFDIGKSDGTLKTPNDISTDMYQVQYKAGARVFSESWGCKSDARSTTCGGAYTSSSAETDKFLWMYPEAVILVANGNTGGSAEGVSYTVGAPATSKSCIGVGASLTENNVFKAFSSSVPDGVTSVFDINGLAYFSSRGPTHGGRVKPEITAPGWWTTSAAGLANSSSPHCTIKTLQGTSMSTPTAAGFAAMIRQYFTDGFYGTGAAIATNAFTPSGALIKAVLIHSTQRLVRSVMVSSTTGKTSVSEFSTTAKLPNSNQGYGRIQIDGGLYFGSASLLCANPLNCPVETAFANGAHTHTSPLSGSATPAELTYFVWGGVSAYTQNVTVANMGKFFYFKTTFAPSTITVSLAYTDYPGTSSESYTESQIKNSLDVVVQGPCTVSGCTNNFVSSLYDASEKNVNPHARVTIAEGSLAASSIYRIYVGPHASCHVTTTNPCSTSTAATMLSGQPFALVASTASAMASDLTSYSAANGDTPFSKYTIPGSPASYISDVATTLIVVFSICTAVLGGLVGVIYMSHKQAARLEEEEIAQRIGTMMHIQSAGDQ